MQIPLICPFVACLFGLMAAQGTTIQTVTTPTTLSTSSISATSTLTPIPSSSQTSLTQATLSTISLSTTTSAVTPPDSATESLSSTMSSTSNSASSSSLSSATASASTNSIAVSSGTVTSVIGNATSASATTGILSSTALSFGPLPSVTACSDIGAVFNMTDLHSSYRGVTVSNLQPCKERDCKDLYQVWEGVIGDIKNYMPATLNAVHYINGSSQIGVLSQQLASNNNDPKQAVSSRKSEVLPLLRVAANHNIQVLLTINGGENDSSNEQGDFTVDKTDLHVALGVAGCKSLAGVIVGNGQLAACGSDETCKALAVVKLNDKLNEIRQNVVRIWGNYCCSVPVTHAEPYTVWAEPKSQVTKELIKKLDGAVVAEYLPYADPTKRDIGNQGGLTLGADLQMIKENAASFNKDLWLSAFGWPYTDVSRANADHTPSPYSSRHFFEENACTMFACNGTAFWHAYCTNNLEGQGVSLPSYELYRCGRSEAHVNYSDVCLTQSPQIGVKLSDGTRNAWPAFAGGEGCVKR